MDLFRGFPFPDNLEVEGLTDILDHYEGVSRAMGLQTHPPDFILSRASDHLSGQGRHQAALEILPHLNRLYPSSLNALWRLANLHRELGDTAVAIRYYEECLRREPNMVVAQEWLERLRGED